MSVDKLGAKYPCGQEGGPPPASEAEQRSLAEQMVRLRIEPSLWLSFASPALLVQEMMEMRYSLSYFVLVRAVKAFACLPACLPPGVVGLPKGMCVCLCVCVCVARHGHVF